MLDEMNMSCLLEILGQEMAIATLKSAIANQKVAHAYLFAGPKGVGKATTALAFARALFCQTGQGCNDCPDCHKLLTGNHPDFVTITKDGTQIKIDQIRALEGLLKFPPYEARYRIVVIDDADLLNPNAANALLKSLEEPFTKTIFILVTSAAHRVIPTIVSRCQRIRFTPLDDKTVEKVISRNSTHNKEEILSAITLCEGSPGHALSLLEGEQVAMASSLANSFWDVLNKKDASSIFEIASNAAKDRATLQNTLELLRIWLRDLLLVSQGFQNRTIVNQNKIEELKSMAKQFSYSAILNQLRSICSAQQALQRYINPTLTIETMLLQMRQGLQNDRRN